MAAEDIVPMSAFGQDAALDGKAVVESMTDLRRYVPEGGAIIIVLLAHEGSVEEQIVARSTQRRFQKAGLQTANDVLRAKRSEPAGRQRREARQRVDAKPLRAAEQIAINPVGAQ